MDMSALNEIGNIVSGSYLNALAALTGMKMISTVPGLTIDMVGALLSVPAAEFGIKYINNCTIHIQIRYCGIDN